jgi:nucleoside-diphosphate-sugar epimerase
MLMSCVLAQTRDFVCVKDIAAGISRALEAPNLEPFTACNLGCGRAIPILQLAETMRGFFPRWESRFNYAPAPPGDIAQSAADIPAARRSLSYRPQYSLETGLAEMLQAVQTSEANGRRSPVSSRLQIPHRLS